MTLNETPIGSDPFRAESRPGNVAARLSVLDLVGAGSFRAQNRGHCVNERGASCAFRVHPLDDDGGSAAAQPHRGRGQGSRGTQAKQSLRSGQAWRLAGRDDVRTRACLTAAPRRLDALGRQCRSTQQAFPGRAKLFLRRKRHFGDDVCGARKTRPRFRPTLHWPAAGALRASGRTVRGFLSSADVVSIIESVGRSDLSFRPCWPPSATAGPFPAVPRLLRARATFPQLRDPTSPRPTPSRAPDNPPRSVW